MYPLTGLIPASISARAFLSRQSGEATFFQ